MAVLLLAASCCTHRTAHTAYAANSVATTVQQVRDSIFVCDSVLLKVRADTVFVTRTRTQYRDRIRIDTLWRCDTVVYVKESMLPAKKSSRNIFFWIAAFGALFLLLKFGKVIGNKG